jgi:hypothetical protein
MGQGPNPFRQQPVLVQSSWHHPLGQPDREDDIGVQADRRRQRCHQHPGAESPLARQVIGQFQFQHQPQRGQICG